MILWDRFIFKNNAFPRNQGPCRALRALLSFLPDDREELSTNHQIFYLHGSLFLLVSALHTSSIMAHNLIWTGKWPSEMNRVRRREKGRMGRRHEQNMSERWLLITYNWLGQKRPEGKSQDWTQKQLRATGVLQENIQFNKTDMWIKT